MRPRVALSISPHIWAKAALAFSQLFLRGIISQIQIVGMHRECLRHKSPEHPPPLEQLTRRKFSAFLVVQDQSPSVGVYVRWRHRCYCYYGEYGLSYNTPWCNCASAHYLQDPTPRVGFLTDSSKSLSPKVLWRNSISFSPLSLSISGSRDYITVTPTPRSYALSIFLIRQLHKVNRG